MARLSRRGFLGTVAVPAALGIPAPPAVAAPAAGFPDASLPDDRFFRELRSQFVIPANEAFFNTCTLGAMPRTVIDAVAIHLRTAEETLAAWDYRAEHFDRLTGYGPETELRAKLAQVIHADPEEIAVTQNATFGMNFLAHGVDLKPGDEVIQTDQEHPGGQCGWQMRAKRDGIVWKPVAVGHSPEEIVAAFERAMTPRTRVLAFPHITSALGIVMPVKQLADLAHSRDALCFVDGAQAVGQLGVDVHAMEVDAYYSSPHKWLLAPPGSGLLYIRRDRLPRVWTTLASAEWDNQKAGALRFMQYGTGNLSMIKGYEAAADFHLRIGSQRVERRILALANRLREGLKQIPGVEIHSRTHPQLAGAVTTWGIRGWDGARIMDTMWERERIRVRAVGPGVRQCCHIYNSPEDVDRTVATARRLAR